MAVEHDHEAMKWLQLFVEDIDSAPHQLWNWLKQNNSFRPKFMPPRSAKPIERAERYAIAVMLKHLGLVKEAQSLLQKVSAGELLPSDTKAKFSLLARQTWHQVGQWIHQRSQIEADLDPSTLPNRSRLADGSHGRARIRILRQLQRGPSTIGGTLCRQRC